MKQSSKRLISVLLSFLFIAGAFLLFFDLVQPTYSDMQNLRSQQLGEETYLKNQTELAKQVQTILNTYQNEAQSVANVGLAMPSGADIAGALTQIQGIAASTGVTITSIAVTPPTIQLRPQQGGAATSTALLKPLGSFTFKLSAAGTYESFKNFLSEIETNIRIFDVKDASLMPAPATTISLRGVPPSATQFNYTITVATYYQTQ